MVQKKVARKTAAKKVARKTAAKKVARKKTTKTTNTSKSPKVELHEVKYFVVQIDKKQLFACYSDDNGFLGFRLGSKGSLLSGVDFMKSLPKPTRRVIRRALREKGFTAALHATLIPPTPKPTVTA